MTVKVSVVIPTYNRAEMVVQAVESVLQQQHQPWEIVVVDDGSTDNTKKRLSKYLPHVTLLHQPHSGVSAARNRGIKYASGNWIAFLDSDDLWVPHKLRRQVEYISAHPDALIVYTDEIWMKKGKRVNQCAHHRKACGWIFQASLNLCLVSPSSVMIHREVFDESGIFDETLTVCEDYELWLRMSHRIPFHFIDEPLIVKQGGHADQLSQRYWGMDRFRIMALKRLLQWTELSPSDRKQVRKVIEKKERVMKQGLQKRRKDVEWLWYLPHSEAGDSAP